MSEKHKAVSILKRWAEPLDCVEVLPRKDGTFVVAHPDGGVEIVGPGHENFEALTEDKKRKDADVKKRPFYGGLTEE